MFKFNFLDSEPDGVAPEATEHVKSLEENDVETHHLEPYVEVSLNDLVSYYTFKGYPRSRVSNVGFRAGESTS